MRLVWHVAYTREITNRSRILAEKPEGKRSHGRYKSRWRIRIRWIL
jgi:hypothetical protein